MRTTTTTTAAVLPITCIPVYRTSIYYGAGSITEERNGILHIRSGKLKATTAGRHVAGQAGFLILHYIPEKLNRGSGPVIYTRYSRVCTVVVPDMDDFLDDYKKCLSG